MELPRPRLRYYRGGCGCKKLHPPLPPLLLLNLAWRHGTTAPQHGTTAWSADVKNYIRAYYRLSSGTRPDLTVLLLRRSGTTMEARGTTVPEPGTIAGSCGSTAQKSSTTASLRRATRRPSFRRDKVRQRNTLRSSRKGGVEGNVYVRFHPNLSKMDPLSIVRLSYDSTPPYRTVEKRCLQ